MFSKANGQATNPPPPTTTLHSLDNRTSPVRSSSTLPTTMAEGVEGDAALGKRTALFSIGSNGGDHHSGHLVEDDTTTTTSLPISPSSSSPHGKAESLDSLSATSSPSPLPPLLHNPSITSQVIGAIYGDAQILQSAALFSSPAVLIAAELPEELDEPPPSTREVANQRSGLPRRFSSLSHIDRHLTNRESLRTVPSFDTLSKADLHSSGIALSQSVESLARPASIVIHPHHPSASTSSVAEDLGSSETEESGHFEYHEDDDPDRVLFKLYIIGIDLDLCEIAINECIEIMWRERSDLTLLEQCIKWLEKSTVHGASDAQRSIHYQPTKRPTRFHPTFRDYGTRASLDIIPPKSILKPFQAPHIAQPATHESFLKKLKNQLGKSFGKSKRKILTTSSSSSVESTIILDSKSPLNRTLSNDSRRSSDTPSQSPHQHPPAVKKVKFSFPALSIEHEEEDETKNFAKADVAAVSNNSALKRPTQPENILSIGLQTTGKSLFDPKAPTGSSKVDYIKHGESTVVHAKSSLNAQNSQGHHRSTSITSMHDVEIPNSSLALKGGAFSVSRSLSLMSLTNDWQSLPQDAESLKLFYLQCCEKSSIKPNEKLLASLTDSSQTFHFDLSDIPLTAMDVNIISGIFTDRVTVLNMSKCGLRNASLQVLLSCLQSIGTINRLQLAYNELTESSMNFLSKFLRSAPCLKYLDISGLPISDEGAHFLKLGLETPVSSGAPPACVLETLVLNKCSLTSSSLGIIASVVRKSSLRRLYLQRNELPSGSMKAILELLKTHEELSLETRSLVLRGLFFLDLGYNKFQDGVGKIGAGLLKNTILTDLNLEHNEIKSAHLVAFYPGLSLNRTLKHLNLSGNPLTLSKKGLPVKLLALCNLSSLNISNADLGVFDFISLSESIPLVKSLKSLTVSYNDIDVSSAMALAAAMKSNMSITTLQLTPILIPKKPIQEAEEAEILRLFTVISDYCDRNRRAQGGKGSPPAKASVLSSSSSSNVHSESSLMVQHAQELVCEFGAMLNQPKSTINVQLARQLYTEAVSFQSKMNSIPPGGAPLVHREALGTCLRQLGELIARFGALFPG